ncbi:hypothetical protein [Jidongwangia harbinensis]|uniref:hypothetical protein n=1 Tax=Jidongwangia harbinensis TaxID=2878561 RepID=UPI001CD99FBB|nr:hypothetical protein [Jidongwangia harbinensis]MCA2211865.1 hypothetical protein [Jidongwangia harbinensis]
MSRRLLCAVLLLPVAACGTSGDGRAATPQPTVSAAATTSPSPSASAAPGFVELTGDASTSVRVVKLDFRNRSAVVEPIVFMHGPDYCKAMKISPIEQRCSQEVVIEGNKTKVTLPIAADVDLRTIGHGEECIGTMTGGATCRASLAEFTRNVGEGVPVWITLDDGTIAKIAELYTP